MSMNDLFKYYEKRLVAGSDLAFAKASEAHPDCVACRPGCSDCCRAVFGLFLVEAAYLKDRFEELPDHERSAALERCELADRDLKRLEKKLQVLRDDPAAAASVMATERVRCPLLNDESECILYPHRPITCRVYGIPTVIEGKARVCGKALFQSGTSYPAFNMDELQRELFLLSKDLIEMIPGAHADSAGLLLSVSKVLQTPLDDIVRESFAEGL